jgi:hypothetical protein
MFIDCPLIQLNPKYNSFYQIIIHSISLKGKSTAILTMEIIFASWLGDHEGIHLFFLFGHCMRVRLFSRHGLLTISKAKTKIAGKNEEKAEIQ